MKKLTFLGALASLFMATSAQATSLTAFDQGWYSESGQHNPSSLNSYTLAGHYRSFFAFDLSSTTTAASAISITFAANNGYTRGGSLGFYDYIAPVSTLLSGAAGAAGYRDLGDGWMFGQAALAEGMMPEFTVQLSDGFVNQFNAVRLSDDKRIALGASAFFGEFWSGSGAMAGATLNVTAAPPAPPAPPPTPDTPPPQPDTPPAEPDAPLAQQATAGTGDGEPYVPDFESGEEIDLTPAAVPEPATLTLFGLGLLGVVAGRRRRRS